MTRPKVDPAKRQRIANACDSCKRRKQKCDGEQPCSNCVKKQFSCLYTENSGHGGLSSPEMSTHKRIRTNGGSLGGISSSQSSYTPNNHGVGPNSWRPGGDTPLIGDSVRAAHHFQPMPDVRPEVKALSDHASTSGGEEEVVDNHTMTRMLDEGTGRVIYIGDSATLSFLQLLRMIVETVAGPTPFSLDPARHTMLETQLSLPADLKLTHRLPTRETAMILVDSFFVNSHGLIQVFDEKSFLADVDKVYSDPLTVDRVYLCHLNLVLAIGYCLATPEVGSREAAIIDDVRSKYPNQSEVFFLNAKSINNPIVGFEDGDVWSIQALLLMAVYMLLRSKRNAAFAYLGMAVRTAYTLGLHREETLVIFPENEQTLRKGLWRSLFTIDRFLAAHLGRPVAIAEEECSGESLNPQTNTFSKTTRLAPGQVCSAGLEACARSCHVIGLILSKVYLQRRVSTRLAQEIAEECRQWPENLSPALHWRQASSNDRRQAIAILHSNLAYCHSIILLTRPFFLYLMSSEFQRIHLGSDRDRQRSQTRIGKREKFSNACIIASTHTVALVQNAFDGGYLPKMNSFVSYSLFAAALIIFANEWARPSSNLLTQQCMANSITILSYCGEMDPQAKRSAHVLSDFRNTIRQQGQQAAFQVPPPPAFQAPLPALVSGHNTFMPTLESDFTTILPLPGATSAPSTVPGPATTAPFASSTLAPPQYPWEDSFSGLLDLNNTVLPSFSDQDSAHGTSGDESIEFDTLWGQWPASTPAGPAISGGDDASAASLFEQV